nr:lipopolysaccharide biosynthesis protein [uncultured Albidiferax sp.]
MSKITLPKEQISGNQIAKGAAWLMLFKMVDKGVGLVSTLILARLLTPADFGLVAMATAVLAFSQLMSAFGFDSALIQRQEATREHYDTAWSFNVVFGVSIASLLVALSVPMAQFYGDPRLVAILIVLGFSALVGGFENVGTVAFRKDLNFRSEFHFLVAKRIATFVVTVGLAITLKTYWALVAGALAGRVMSLWISYRLHPFRPRFSLAARHDLMHFSKWIFLSSLIGFFTGRSTDFVLGRTVGSTGLGIYNVALEIASMPSTELIAPLNRAVYPVYARLASDPEALRARFLEVFGIICLIGFPVSGGLFGAADAAVRVVLGPQWLDSIPLIRIFAVCGLMGALQSNLYLVIVAMNKPQVNTLLSGCLLVVTLPLTIWSSLHYGVQGAAYSMLFYSSCAITGIVFLFCRLTHIRPTVLLGVCWRPALCAAAMVAGITLLDQTLQAMAPGLYAVGRLGILVLAGAFSYAFLSWLLWAVCGSPKGAERMLLEFITQRRPAWLRRSGTV